MTTKEQQLQSMVRIEQRNELSSDEEDERQFATSKSDFRKPIRNPFSDQSDDSDSDLQPNRMTGNPFPPKPPQMKSPIQEAQLGIKWDKTEQLQNQILTRLEGQGMKDKKIRQLASKLKSLNISYEKQKTMRKSLENQLNDLMKTNEVTRKSSKEKTKNMENSLVKTGDKCSNCQQNEKKVMQFRLKSQNLKSQLNKAMRVIEREIGQNFNIDQVLNGDNAWRGRQQKIDKLKGKVKELQEKLQTNGINVSHMSGFTQATNINNKTNNNFSSTRTSAMQAQNKRKQFENLKVQSDALKTENEILQGKVKSLASRKVILQNEMKEMKQEFEKKKQILLEKSNNDDKFISLLKAENQKLKKEQRVITKVIYKDEQSNTAELKKQIEMLRKKLRSVSQQVQNREQASNQPKAPLPAVKKLDRQVSAKKKKDLEEEYLRGNKYLKKMTPQDEEELYHNWKKNLN